MIIARVPEGIRVIMQTDHQSQCGLLAAHWGNTQFRRPEPWQPVVEAAFWHDEGWREWERHPGVQPDGTPRGFVEMHTDDHMAIHGRSIAAAEHRDPVAGMLVGMHCAGLVQRRMGLDGEMPDITGLPAPAGDLIRHESHARSQLQERMGDPAEVQAWTWAAYRVLQALDLLSLYLTWTGLITHDTWTLRRVPAAADDVAGYALAVTSVDAHTCAVDPWPFADDVVTAPVAARIIPDRQYADTHDLGTTIAAATVVSVPFRVVGVPSPRARASART